MNRSMLGSRIPCPDTRRPALVAKLLTELFHVEVPRFTEARLAEAALHQLVPVAYDADAVVLFVEDTPGARCQARSDGNSPRRFSRWPRTPGNRCRVW
jgi:hypothetical protein